MAEGFLRIPLLVEVAHQRREHVSVGGPPPMRRSSTAIDRSAPRWPPVALRRTPEQIERLPRPAANAHGEGRAREGSRPMHMGADLQQVLGRENTGHRAGPDAACSPAPVAAIDGQHVELADIKSQYHAKRALEIAGGGWPQPPDINERSYVTYAISKPAHNLFSL